MSKIQESRQATIIVIDPATRHPEIQDFNNIIKLSNTPCQYHLPGLLGCASLQRMDIKQPMAIIIMGSAAHPDDHEPWQQELESWLLSQIKLKTPILGLCYGHQLLARIHGAKLSRHGHDTAKKQGLRRVTVRDQASSSAPDQLDLIVSHRDEVLDLPKGAQILASSIECPIDGLWYPRQNIWSYQAHPEATDGFLVNQSIQLDPSEAQSAMTHGHRLVARFLSGALNQFNEKT